jgi:hypothetical protein
VKDEPLKITYPTKGKLAPYLFIPHGTIKLLAVVSLLAGLATLAVVMLPGDWKVVGLFVIFATVLFTTVITGGCYPFLWLHAYWSQNIRGYELWSNCNVPGGGLGDHFIVRRGDILGIDGLWLVTPLNEFGRCRFVENSLCPRWNTSRIRKMVPRFPRGMTDSPIITVHDQEGDRVSLDIQDAYNVCFTTFIQMGHLWFRKWRDVVSGIFEKKVFYEEMARGREKREHVVWGIVETAGKLIAATTRFGRSRDGRRIREWLEACLAQRHSSSPLRPPASPVIATPQPPPVAEA